VISYYTGARGKFMAKYDDTYILAQCPTYILAETPFDKQLSL